MEKRLLNPSEAASVIGISRTTIYELIASGSLGSVKIGARRLIPVNEIDEYVDRLIAQYNGDAA